MDASKEAQIKEFEETDALAEEVGLKIDISEPDLSWRYIGTQSQFVQFEALKANN